MKPIPANPPYSLWRPAAMIGLLAILALVAVEGAQLAKVWASFSDARQSWVRVATSIEDVSVVRRAGAAHAGFFSRQAAAQYTLGVRVRYTLSGAIYHTTAWGWPESFRWLAKPPGGGLAVGVPIAVRADPTNLGRATLLGDWTGPSTWILGRLALTELIFVIILLFGMREAGRHFRPRVR